MSRDENNEHVNRVFMVQARRKIKTTRVSNYLSRVVNIIGTGYHLTRYVIPITQPSTTYSLGKSGQHYLQGVIPQLQLFREEGASQSAQVISSDTKDAFLLLDQSLAHSSYTVPSLFMQDTGTRTLFFSVCACSLVGLTSPSCLSFFFSVLTGPPAGRMGGTGPSVSFQ